MKFNAEKLEFGNFVYYVWSRNSDDGDIVIVVIDDDCEQANENPEDLDTRVAMSLPLLRQCACNLQDVLAIGFFPLIGQQPGINEILDEIEKWLAKFPSSRPYPQVYFLVDVYNRDRELAGTKMKEELKKIYDSEDRIEYFSQAGGGQARNLDIKFDKGTHATYMQDHQALHPDLLEFIGITNDLHQDEIINDAIQFYAKPWEENWDSNSWHHDWLQPRNSQLTKHLEELASWLDVSGNDLVYNSSTKTDSAKNLMIWDDEKLWEGLPWMARDHRRIQGNVLNAVLKKFKIIEDNLFQDDESIIMPCVPCFPFLVSLKGFLWCCEEEGTPVRKIQFFKLGEKPQANILRLILPLKDSAKHFVASFRGVKRQGATVKSLTNLTYSRTDKLKGNETYMQLFIKGADFPVVNVEIAPYRESSDNRELGQIIPHRDHSPQESLSDNRKLGQINLIWSVK